MSTPAPTNYRSVSTRWGLVGCWLFSGFRPGSFFGFRDKPLPVPNQSPSSGIQLIEGANHKLLQEMAHEDPELLSQPNPRGFSETWLKPKPFEHQPHRWSPPDIELLYPSNLIIEPLVATLASNSPPQAVAFLKPSPKLFPMDVALARIAPVELAGNNWRSQDSTAGKNPFP